MVVVREEKVSVPGVARCGLTEVTSMLPIRQVQSLGGGGVARRSAFLNLSLPSLRVAVRDYMECL